MYRISRSALYSVGPGLTRPSIIIHLFFFVAIGIKRFSSGCLPITTFVCGNSACSGVVVYVVHAVGYLWSQTRSTPTLDPPKSKRKSPCAQVISL